MYCNSNNVMRRVIYGLPHDLHHNCRFAPMIAAHRPEDPSSGDLDQVDWSLFHSVQDASKQVEAPSVPVHARLSQGMGRWQHEEAVSIDTNGAAN